MQAMVLVMPMYSSNSNFNNETLTSSTATSSAAAAAAAVTAKTTNGEQQLLNISGKRYNRNVSKTIWSYNPDDILTKRINTKWRPNSSVLKPPVPPSTLISANYNCSKLIDEYRNITSAKTASEQQHSNKPTLITDIQIQQSLYSPRQIVPQSRKSSSSSSSTSSSGGHKNKLNIVSSIGPTDSMNRFLESNTSASRRLKMQQQQQLQEQQALEKFDKKLLFRESSIVQPDNKIKIEKLNKDIKKMINNLNDDSQQQPAVYGKHIDNLTTELLVALSNGIDKNLILKRTQSASVSHQSIKEKSTSSSIRTSSTNLNELVDIEQELADEDNFVMKICNEIKTCKLANSEEGEKKKSNKTNHRKSVEASTVDDRHPDAEFLRRPSKNQIPDSYHDLNKLLNNEPIPDSPEEFPSSYFDAKFHEGDFSFRYKKVVDEQFRQILDQYDGNLPVELVLKQTLPLNDFYSALAANSPPTAKPGSIRDAQAVDKQKQRPKSSKSRKNDESSDTVYVNKDYETYNILKRMMVKKKYEAATVKLENTADKRKRRSTSSLSIVPNASAPNLGNLTNNTNPSANAGIKIKTRSSTSTSFSLTPSATNLASLAENNSILSKPFPEDDDDEEDEKIDDDDDYTIGEPIIRCAKCKKKFVPKKNGGRSTPSSELASISKDDFYDEFKMTKENLKKKKWPYELDTNATNVEDMENTNNNNEKQKLYRCYTCSNLGVEVKFKSQSESNFVSSEKQMQNKPMVVTIAATPVTSSRTEKPSVSQKGFDVSTYNSVRRVMSAKCIKLVNTEPTIHADKNENCNLKCSHPRKMSHRELVQFQRRSVLIPGKTFTSQRRQSISINRPPLSKIKADYDREKELNSSTSMYPLVRFSSDASIAAATANQTASEPQLTVENTPKRQTVETQMLERSPHDKKIALKNFKIEPFNPTSAPKFRLYQNELLDSREITDSSIVSAFHIYKKASRLIRRRPKTAK